MPKQHSIASRIIEWFEQNKRELPWRLTKDPYRIWLSEVILQQTRVAQGLPYYIRFTEAFPDVFALANASEQEVIKLWQGLGYYSRARNLHNTAKQVAEKYNGQFPDNYKELSKLKGIGDYTASAILSIAFDQPYAVLDGNVYRVLARLYNIDVPINTPEAKPVFKKLADEQLDKKQAAVYNEAIMEFGATLCTPKNPLCPDCPVQEYCDAFANGTVNELPQKAAAREVKTRHFHYLIIKNKDGLYLHQRHSGDIWQGLYDFPLVENNSETVDIKTAGGALGVKLKSIKPLSSIKHKLTHQTLLISFHEAISLKSEQPAGKDIIFASFDELEKYPLPKPVELFLENYLS
jgi:A/G-specific adenine glycosylase